MTPMAILLSLTAACGLWAGVSAVLLARALERHGVTTPLPFLGVLVFRNLHRYREVTRNTTGRAGPLFYSYVVPINAALLFAAAAFVVGWLGW